MYTIAAIASGTAPAAIGVIRLSGDDALGIIRRCVHRQELTPRMMHHRVLYTPDGEAIDDVLVCYFKAPHSYTGEDSVEIYAHGGSVNLGRVLELVCEAGATPAQPGEFSTRAFLNGKIDLSKAEAIMDIIHAQNVHQCREAQRQLSGSVSHAVEALRTAVLNLLCHIEASIDFSTEEDLAPFPTDLVRRESSAILHQIERMKRAHDQYRADGLRVVFTGAPNVGKSSLFNHLLGHERAIVTDIAGTTTDSIEAQVALNHQTFCLIDTAGVADAQNSIEQLGIMRSREQIRQADILLVLLDGQPSDRRMWDELRALYGDDIDDAAHRQTWVFVHTKADQARPDLDPEILSFIERARSPLLNISVRTNAGLAELESTLTRIACERSQQTEDVTLITSQRHISCLDHASTCIQRSLAALDAGLPAECIAEDLHEAAQSLAAITGAFASEDIVNAIFSQFCIGK